MRPLLLLVLVAAASALPGLAAAQPSGEVAAHAIVVGSNAGGPGQEDLRYAERDAERVAAVLRDLGGYPADHVRLIRAPSPDQLLDAIDEVAVAAADDAAAGRRTIVFFYYSGHARASALVLGDAEVPLAELRARLTKLPATVTVVVLDACQSGAFTRVKGAEPAADFSFNSRTGLDAEGIAVMASSSESELSQESDFLEGSYFTHHLLVGLRGGGDADDDGRVSLDEAYRYAYHQTLVATSHTAVGSQHVRLEVDLEGHGEVPLTYPEKADATLTLANGVAGDVLVQRLPAEAVLAEVHKTAGASFDVAIPAGRYRVLVRTAEVVHRCPVTVAPGRAATVDLAGCDEVPLIEETAKHGAPRLRNPWTVTVGLAGGSGPDDAFTRRLETFGYTKDLFAIRDALSIGVVRRLVPHVAATLRLTRIGSETWRRDTESEPMEYSTTSHLVTLGARAELASASDRSLLWAAAGAGVTWSRERFEDEMDQVSHGDFFGAHLTGALGATLIVGRGVGVEAEGRWLYAPTVENQLADPDTLDVGGVFVGVSVVYRPRGQ